MIVIVAADSAEAVTSTLRDAGEAPVALGTIVKDDGTGPVRFTGHLDL